MHAPLTQNVPWCRAVPAVHWPKVPNKAHPWGKCRWTPTIHLIMQSQKNPQWRRDIKRQVQDRPDGIFPRATALQACLLKPSSRTRASLTRTMKVDWSRTPHRFGRQSSSMNMKTADAIHNSEATVEPIHFRTMKRNKIGKPFACVNNQHLPTMDS
jgi:hypothetical protein